MRRQWILLLLVVPLLALLLAGCGGKKEQPVNTNPVVVPEETPPPPVPEQPKEEETTPPPVDYHTLAPQEYGIRDVFFAFDDYSLSDEAMATLGENARIIKEHPDVVYLIEGHCDERGTVEYNLALGEKRAKAVRDYLVALGVPASQLRITSYGEERPFALGHDEAAWAQNRRAHFSLP